MELRDYLKIMRERWMLIVVCLLAGGLIAGIVSLTTAPTYRATSQLYVSVQTQDGSTQNLAQGSSFSQSQVVGFADLATSPLVLRPVIAEGGLGISAQALADKISASVKQNTSLINVTVTASSAEEAAGLSNAVAQSMTVVLPELQRPLDTAISPVRITVTREAVAPGAQATPNVRLNLSVGLLAGFFVGVGAAVLRTTLDTRVRSESDLALVTSSPVLGTVGFDASAPQDPLAIHSAPLSARAEAIRRLRTNLQFISAPSRPRTIVVTSSLPGEGKSTTATNLALALADAGSKVILVDADLRRPALAKIFQLEGAVGLTTVLIGRAEVDDVVQRFADTKLDVLASGEIPPNPSELLGSPQMTSLLAELATRYDVVILDSAPLLPVTDGAVLAKLADGALVVVGANTAHRQHVATALTALETVHARILGVVLNRVPAESRDEYSYYDYSVKPAVAPTVARARSNRWLRGAA